MRSSRPPPPPPPASGIGGDEGPDVVANSAMIALQRLAQDNESLQAEVRHLRDQIAVDGQEHARLIETYRLEHEEDVRKLQNGVKLATALAEENAALKNQANRRSVPGANPGARGGGGGGASANDDVNDIQQIEREVAILQSNVVRLDARWGRRRNDAGLGIGNEKSGGSAGRVEKSHGVVAIFILLVARGAWTLTPCVLLESVSALSLLYIANVRSWLSFLALFQSTVYVIGFIC